jgi:hypothetical protein
MKIWADIKQALILTQSIDTVAKQYSVKSAGLLIILYGLNNDSFFSQYGNGANDWIELLERWRGELLFI